MGFFDKLAGSVKETGKNISQELKRRQELYNTKQRILDRFDLDDLKKICRAYGVQEPQGIQENIFTGQKSRYKVTRDDYINKVINNLSLEQIKNFSDKHKIKIWDIIKEHEKASILDIQKVDSLINPSSQSNVSTPISPEKEVTTIDIKKQSEFEAILESIENDFEPEDVRDENDFEKQLTQFLKIKYPDRVKRQVDTPKGKIDILIDDRYVIELKIADSKIKLRDLVGQVTSYKKVYCDIAIALLDVGKLSRSEIKEYVDDYEQIGVKTIVLEGLLKKRKRRQKQINIKF